MTIGDLLGDQARLASGPVAHALIDARAGSGRWRLPSFTGRSPRRRRRSGPRRLRRGDAVLVFVPMSADLYVALLGLFRFGAVALFLDPLRGTRTPRGVLCTLDARRATRGSPGAPSPTAIARAASHTAQVYEVAAGFPDPALATARLRCDRRGNRFATRAPALPVHPRPSPPDPALVTFTVATPPASQATVGPRLFLLAQYRTRQRPACTCNRATSISPPCRSLSWPILLPESRPCCPTRTYADPAAMDAASL
ncbi:MAG: hypothetical protein U1F61_09710 [Opitutaceae bacterium]